MDDFIVLILTHGRADNLITFETLRRQGYTGRIALVLDNEDTTADEYRERYGDEPGVEIVVFDKAAIAETFDTGDNSSDRRTIVYARNASFQIAKDLGARYFVQLDDDYVEFCWRFTSKLEFAQARHWTDPDGPGFYPQSLDRLFEAFVSFLRETPARTIAMAQGGDFIGGPNGSFGKLLTLRRKAMNSFFCDVERPITFLGRINEDVTTYTRRAVVGDLFFTYNFCALNQVATATSEGGITAVYQGAGPHVKPMYSVISHPSGVEIRVMNSRSSPRIHHAVMWDKTAPKILREEHRKPR